MDILGLQPNVYLEVEPILEIFETLGPEAVAMYVLLQSIEQPIAIPKLVAWSHLPEEKVLELCGQLGMLQLGIQVSKIED